MKWYIKGKLIKCTKDYDLSGFKFQKSKEELDKNSLDDIKEEYQELYETVEMEFLEECGDF